MNMDNRDEKLGAYMDGELSADEAAALEEELAADAGLQARLDALLATNDATRKLFAEVDKEPMPEAVLALLEEKQTTSDNVVALPVRAAKKVFSMPVAIAASVALVVGFLVVDLSRQAAGPISSMEALSAGSIATDSTLHRLLEETNSGQAVKLGNDETGEAVLSFADASGRYCRQVQITASDNAAHALACRGENSWEVEALAFTDPAPDGQFQPAGATTPVDIISAVDTLIGDADPLDSEQENQAISDSWKKTD